MKYNLILTLFFAANIYADIYEYSGAKKHAGYILEPNTKSTEEKDSLEDLFKRLLNNCNKHQTLKDADSIYDEKDTEAFNELSRLDLATKNAILRKALSRLNSNDIEKMRKTAKNLNLNCLVIAALYSGADLT